MRKSSVLYIIIIVAWLFFVVLLGLSTAFLIMRIPAELSMGRRIAISVLLCVNSLTLALLWFGSVKDLCFSVCYAVKRRSFSRRYAGVSEAKLPDRAPRFVLLYCTCNDFNETALRTCIGQDYENFTAVILDDSSDEAYRKKIDFFAAEHHLEVVRREKKTGFKAGNLNHYLHGRADYDYFVVLDSDEVIPPDYIKSVLRYFTYYPACGAVQARHAAHNAQNAFQRLMGMSVESNGRTAQVVKNFYGANALIGHGMTLSRACYEGTGGFPLVVAEDISMAVDIKNAGYEIIYAPDILCFEEFPVNYLSLKKRQCKWTQGNLEYMRKYHREITSSRMNWEEKLDIILSHYSLPVVPVLSLLLAVCMVALGFLDYPVIGYSLVVYALMILFLCSPLLPDLFVHRKGNGWLLAPYFLVNIATYASFAPMMLRTVFLGLIGKKAVFLVTPKKNETFTFVECLRGTVDSLVFALVLGLLSWLSCGSVLPVIYVCAGCVLSPFIILLSNLRGGNRRSGNGAAEIRR